MFEWFFKPRRPEIKKSDTFTLGWYLADRPPVPGCGLEITPTKLAFRTPYPPSKKEFNIEFELHARKLHARVKSARPRLVSTPLGYQHELLCEFTGISADDWDCIMRYLRDVPEANFEGSFFDPNKPDDEFRSLPLNVQKQIIDDLVVKGRLNAPVDDTAPLIRLLSQGLDRAAKGRKIAKYLVRSRYIVEAGGVKTDFDTRYTIADGIVHSVGEKGKHMYSADHSASV